MKKRWIWIVCMVVVLLILIYDRCTEKKFSIQTDISSYSTLSSSIQGIKMDVHAKNLSDVEYFWTTNHGMFIDHSSKEGYGLSVIWSGPSLAESILDGIKVTLSAKNRQGKIVASSSLNIERRGGEYHIITN